MNSPQLATKTIKNTENELTKQSPESGIKNQQSAGKYVVKPTN